MFGIFVLWSFTHLYPNIQSAPKSAVKSAAKENTEDTYDIGYITALSRAELEIEKLIKKVSQ